MTDQPTPRNETAASAPDSTPTQEFYLETDALRRPKPNDEPVLTLPPASILNMILIAITFLVIGVLIGQNLPGTGSALSADEVQQIVRNVLADSNLISDVPSNEELADDDPALGPIDAPIVIVEFSDFRCPYCGRHFRNTLEPLLENYEGYVRYVYRDYPALGDESAWSALAANCAYEQGKFWEVHKIFFDNPDKLGRAFYISTAEEQGLDVEAFTTCLNSQQYFDEIKSDFIDGQLNGVEGTPGFFINGTFVRGAQPYELFEKIINRELNKQGITPPVPRCACGGPVGAPVRCYPGGDAGCRQPTGCAVIAAEHVLIVIFIIGGQHAARERRRGHPRSALIGICMGTKRCFCKRFVQKWLSFSTLR
ncbi:DsbA family protein [bacterium]|nr:DsbA family protein [bacterium]